MIVYDDNTVLMNIGHAHTLSQRFRKRLLKLYDVFKCVMEDLNYTPEYYVSLSILRGIQIHICTV